MRGNVLRASRQRGKGSAWRKPGGDTSCARKALRAPTSSMRAVTKCFRESTVHNATAEHAFSWLRASLANQRYACLGLDTPATRARAKSSIWLNRARLRKAHVAKRPWCQSHAARAPDITAFWTSTAASKTSLRHLELHSHNLPSMCSLGPSGQDDCNGSSCARLAGLRPQCSLHESQYPGLRPLCISGPIPPRPARLRGD